MKKAAIEDFFATLKAANPLPTTELQYTTVFELLAAVLLSAKATRRLFAVANTPQKILALGLQGLESYIKTIGLYRSKARHLMQTCQILVDQHQGQVPRDRQALQALPGVGRKTANVVLNCAFGEPVMPVDTHIFRVSNRTGLAAGQNVDAVEARLMQRIPPAYLVHAHHWLILHGRYVCQARKPLCGQCAVSPFCDFKPKTAAP
jgi:endonuclease-3